MLALSIAGCVLFGGVAFVLLSSDPINAANMDRPVVAADPDFEIAMVEVLVPLRDVPEGERLDASMFKKVTRPKIAVSDSAIRDIEEITNMYTYSRLLADMPVERRAISHKAPLNDVTRRIPPGHRAVTISVDAIKGVEGWARPGARVDVLFLSKVNGEPIIRTIVQNAEVLSAERNTATETQSGMPVPSTVTLLVAENDANKVQLAQIAGSLSLSLRGDNDRVGSQHQELVLSDLLGGAKVAAQPSHQGVVRVQRPDGGFDELVVDAQGRLSHQR